MNEHKKTFYRNQAESVIKKLELRKMQGFYCPDIESAKAKVLELMDGGKKTVAYGGSMTIDESGIPRRLHRQEGQDEGAQHHPRRQ